MSETLTPDTVAIMRSRDQLSRGSAMELCDSHEALRAANAALTAERDARKGELSQLKRFLADEEKQATQDERINEHMRHQLYRDLVDLSNLLAFQWDTMPEPSKRAAHRLTREGVDRILGILDRLKREPLPSQAQLAASQAEAARLLEALKSIRAELRDEPGDDDRLARVLALAKVDGALASSAPAEPTQEVESVEVVECKHCGSVYGCQDGYKPDGPE